MFEVCPKCHGGGTSAPYVRPKHTRLSEIDCEPPARIDVGADWNHALGGGAVHGGVTLIAARGGVGKTTEMLRVASRIGTFDEPCLYLLSERYPSEIAAQGANIEDVDLSHIEIEEVSTMRDVFAHVYAGAHVFVDSLGNLEDAQPNHIERIRDAIGTGTAWIIFHVTKDGKLEGREKFSHKASALVWISKTKLSTRKNWWGPILSTRRNAPVFRTDVASDRPQAARPAKGARRALRLLR